MSDACQLPGEKDEKKEAVREEDEDTDQGEKDD